MDKKISELDQALQINNDAAFPFSQLNGGQQTTFKAVITALAVKIAEGITFSNLLTEAKTLVGAINEVSQGGGAAILIGTSAPSSSQGSNGNLYIQYTEGTGGADDTVDALYVKLDGAWCEISTGGTGSTTLAGLTDVSISSPANKEVLQYDGTSQKWKNKSTSIEKTIQNVAIASFTDGADNVPLSELEVEIEPNLSGVSSVTITNKDDLDNPTQTDTYTVSLGGTYYGGTLDVKNGVLTVKYARVELSNYNYGYVASRKQFYTSGVSDFKRYGTGGYQFAFGMCNNYTFRQMSPADAGFTDKSITLYYDSGIPDNRLWIYDESKSTLTPEQFKTAMSGVYLTYELATPIVITGLSETQVKTILGNNNIFADSGDIEKVTYFNINADELADLISVYSNLNALSDVDISNPTNNQVLVYNATTKKWENGTIASGGGHTYSTSEQIVGEWIDGSTIYEQTIYVDSFPNNTSKNLTTPANIDLLIDSFGFMKSTLQTGYFRTLPFAAGGTNDVRIDLNGGTLRVVTFSDWSSYEGYLTIRYTKST